jgi:hypothetical protein
MEKNNKQITNVLNLILLKKKAWLKLIKSINPIVTKFLILIALLGTIILIIAKVFMVPKQKVGFVDFIKREIDHINKDGEKKVKEIDKKLKKIDIEKKKVIKRIEKANDNELGDIIKELNL